MAEVQAEIKPRRTIRDHGQRQHLASVTTMSNLENQSGRKLKCLQTDSGGEFKSEEFVKFCGEHDIRREYIGPYSMDQHRIAERMDRTIEEHVVSLLQQYGLSDGF